jgi:hypothetical protein
MAWRKTQTLIAGALLLLLAAAALMVEQPWRKRSAPAAGPPTTAEPGSELPVAAVQFLGSLGEKRQLPGFVKGDNGQISLPDSWVDKKGGVHSGFGGELIYPVTTTVHASKNGQGVFFHYTVVRDRAGGGWRLAKAWRTDATGRTVENYPVP